MNVLKCKMCGGDISPVEGSHICECEYCGSKQTVPYANDAETVRLFNRATQLRQKYEFDKAASVYESIITLEKTNAEAFWGLVLCRYGIEYVDDPKTRKKIPVCSVMRYESLMDDFDVKTVLMYSDDESREIYQQEISTIETLRKKIIDISYKEKPYDVFICYKATDEQGNRSKESIIGKDYYDELTDKGYRVFFAEVSLEGKLGFEYEPYIFAALNTAKVMLVIGTCNSNLESIWVRNEWERYLSIMAKDRSRIIIPCYSEMEAYDLPDAFSSLQALNVDKLGSKQDLISAIEKAIPKGKQQDQLTAEKVQEEIITTIRYENKKRNFTSLLIAVCVSFVLIIGLIFGIKSLLRIIENNKSTTVIDNTKTIIQEKAENRESINDEAVTSTNMNNTSVSVPQMTPYYNMNEEKGQTVILKLKNELPFDTDNFGGSRDAHITNVKYAYVPYEGNYEFYFTIAYELFGEGTYDEAWTSMDIYDEKGNYIYTVPYICLEGGRNSINEMHYINIKSPGTYYVELMKDT